MATLQKIVSDIRALEVEEIDLVGGGFSLCYESTYMVTTSAFTYTNNGQSFTITAPDDAMDDGAMFMDG